jgi:predicted DNA-binding ribbon-helix-helix protein
MNAGGSKRCGRKRFRIPRRVKREPRESAIKKRSVTIFGKKTSISLEDEFWTAAQDVASERKISLFQFIGTIASRATENISSSLRVEVLEHYIQRSKEGCDS